MEAARRMEFPPRFLFDSCCDGKTAEDGGVSFDFSVRAQCSLCSKFVTSCFSDKVFDFIDLSRAHNDFGAIGLATRTLAAASDEYRTGSGSARVHVSPALEFVVAPDPVATAPGSVFVDPQCRSFGCG